MCGHQMLVVYLCVRECMCIRGHVIHWLAVSFKSIGRWQHYLP